MPLEPPRKLVTLSDVDRRVTYLEKELERRSGLLGRDIGNLSTRLDEVIEGNRTRDHMDSQTDLSIHPDRLRLSFSNVPAWAVVAIVALIAVALVLALR